MEQEVDRLLVAGFIGEAIYPDWMLNVVLVKKSNGKWSMCMDCTDLNNSCPNDNFLLLPKRPASRHHDGYEMFNFMDTFSSYNQIFVYEPDQENTAFITNCELYYYKVMSFGLKNIRATYQQLVNKIFKEWIRHTMKVYIDDMITMSVHASDHAGHLIDTFNVIKHHQMRLNPEKCAFWVTSSKFLNFMVKHRG